MSTAATDSPPDPFAPDHSPPRPKKSRDDVLREIEQAVALWRDALGRGGGGSRASQLRAVEQAVALCRPAFRAYPDLRDHFAAALAVERPNAPPDARAMAAAVRAVEANLLDRIDGLYESEQLREVERGGCVVVVYLGGLAAFLRALCPEHYPARLPEPEPTAAPPGSPEKVRVMAKRVRAGCAVTSPRDADLAGARLAPRANGSGLKVLG